jgi:circadian clock protein KaiB
MKKYAFKLYITGRSSHSQRAIANLQRLCDEALQDDYELSIVDVLEAPEQAEADRILATPTLIRCRPQPMRRVIGDLSDTTKVLNALGL